MSKNKEPITASTDEIATLKLQDYVKRKRRRAFWLGAILGALVLGLIVLVSTAGTSYPASRNHIASVKIEGVILNDEYRQEMIEEISKREDVQGLIVKINSPGGAVYPSEQLYNALRKIGEDIPVVSLMEDTAASGGYITALAGDHIIAGKTTVTGSIGVISEIPNFSDVLDRVGVETTVVRSSDAKGGISPLRDPTPEELADQREVIDGIYQWFQSLVSERRDLTGSGLLDVTKGDVFTGGQALENGLIDEIGGMDEALEYLYGQDEGLEKLEVVDWTPLYPNYAPGQFVETAIQSLTLKAVEGLQNANNQSYFFMNR